MLVQLWCARSNKFSGPAVAHGPMQHGLFLQKFYVPIIDVKVHGSR
uniref:Uncharacterized protein n=1 Tax=Setaria italica TaxID=4555 RepID=K3Y4G7_SETIT